MLTLDMVRVNAKVAIYTGAQIVMAQFNIHQI